MCLPLHLSSLSPIKPVNGVKLTNDMELVLGNLAESF